MAAISKFIERIGSADFREIGAELSNLNQLDSSSPEWQKTAITIVNTLEERIQGSFLLKDEDTMLTKRLLPLLEKIVVPELRDECYQKMTLVFANRFPWHASVSQFLNQIVDPATLQKTKDIVSLLKNPQIREA